MRYENPLPKKISEPSPNPIGLKSEHVKPWAIYLVASLFSLPLCIACAPPWLIMLVFPVGPIASYIVLKLVGLIFPRGLLAAWWDNLFLPEYYEPDVADPKDTGYFIDK